MKLKFFVLPLALGAAVATGACEPSSDSDSSVLIPDETSEEAPSTSSNEPPSSNEPAAQVPESQMAPTPGANSQTEISPEVLDQVARAIGELQQIQQQAEAETVQAIRQEGLSEEQFLSMTLSPPSSEADSTADLTEEEKQKMQRASTQVAQIQQKAQQNMEQAIEDEGLDPQEFNQILAQVEQDPRLMQEVQTRMMQNQGDS